MLPFFSIIIPVYNGLPKCLDSIWNQPMDKSVYEVICVDDCSSDNTREWLKEQTKDHNNLQLILNEENLRQGGSRNKGIKAAKGKYIVFIDQDDYYHPSSLLKIYNHLCSNTIEVLINDSTYQFGYNEHNKLQLNLPFKDITDGENFLLKNGYVCSPWRFTIRRNFLLQNNLYFIERKRLEDIDWALKVLYFAKQIQYFPHILIHYIKGENGTVDNMYKDVQTLIDNIEAGNRTYQLVNSLYKNSVVKGSIIKIACSYYNYSIKCMFGLWTSIAKKKEIIHLIPNIKTNNKLVKVAQQFPILFSIVSNLSVPLFRILRKVHRYRTAKKLGKVC